MLLDRYKSIRARLLGTRRAYQRVFETPEGQIVLHDLLRQCGMLETSMTAGDPHMTHFREGRRSIGLHLVNNLRWSEGELVQLALQRTGEQLADQQGED